jgi:hypothetical protein
MSNYELERQAEIAARKALRAEIQQTAAAVAAALGDTWHLVAPRKPENDFDSNFYFRIADADGRVFAIHAYDSDFRRSGGKLSISGDYPASNELGVSSTPHGMTRPSISVSMSRGAATIAKEITRRFLPDYTAIFLKMAANIHSAAVERAHRGAIALRLAELAGCDMSLSTQHGGGFWHASHNGFRVYQNSGPYPEVKIGYGGAEVAVNNCSEALAAKILALVNDHRKAAQDATA